MFTIKKGRTKKHAEIGVEYPLVIKSDGENPMANKAISADPPLPGAPLNCIVTQCSVRLTPDSRLSIALHH